jgi:hydroxypyruvate isomerase
LKAQITGDSKLRGKKTFAVEKKLIRLVQIGDNPGRCEPGTGEINYGYVFRVLRKLNYSGYLDTEMGSTSTAEYAMAVTRELAYAN